MSSSLLHFGTHPEFSPDTVFIEHLRLPTKTASTICAAEGFIPYGLSMDLQGAELFALRGAGEILDHIQWVLTEVNDRDVYVHCAKVDELDRFLSQRGFERVETYWVPGQGWGDALYRRVNS
jgi:hypothetical protein